MPDHYYRFGNEVETPDGLKSASNTIAVYQHDVRWGLPQTTGYRSTFKGDATFLDLGAGHNVVALLVHGPTGHIAGYMSGLDAGAFARNGRELPWQETRYLTGTAPVTGDLIPTLVTFSDVNDPQSGRVVAPGDFEKVFGPGYRFKRAWVEITSGPVTRTIDKYLPFLKSHEEELTRRRSHTAGDGYIPRMGQFRVRSCVMFRARQWFPARLITA